jgi:DNA-binding transcriptional ArsR family regulator
VSDLSLVLGALADPLRRSLFRRLLSDGPDTATRLADGAPVSRQAVVKHLQVLAEAGLLQPQRSGREVRYAAEPSALDDAVAWMMSAGASWDRRLSRLQDRLSGGGVAREGPDGDDPARLR